VHLRPAPHAWRQHRQLRLHEGVLGRRREVEPVGVLGELAGGDGDQLRMAVAERQHPGAHEKVDEDVAVDVADEAAGRVLDGDRQMPG
jgi:hypothetical protein